MFAEIHLRHKGAITGRVSDENGVGASDVKVVAYRARLPLRIAGDGISDDRGIYRIHGLDPGKYWVRSEAHTLEDGSGWLPTFAPQAYEIHDTRIYPVTVDADTTDADISPEPGKLFHVGGIIACDRDGPVTVVLSSETGRREVQSACKSPYRFDGLAPSTYEVFASIGDVAAGYTERYLSESSDSMNVQVLQVPEVVFEVIRAGMRSRADVPVTIIGRRQDAAQTESARTIPTPRARLAPGHWEFRVQVPRGQYVESMEDPYGRFRHPNPVQPSDWYQVFIEPRSTTSITITVSDKAGEIAGVVKSGDKPAPGAPVFLWPVAESARRSLGGTKQTIADTDGGFHFDSLPPGDYRVLASFDVIEIDQELADAASAPTVHVDASQTTNIELPVWVAP